MLKCFSKLLLLPIRQLIPQDYIRLWHSLRREKIDIDLFQDKRENNFGSKGIEQARKSSEDAQAAEYARESKKVKSEKVEEKLRKLRKNWENWQNWKSVTNLRTDGRTDGQTDMGRC